MSVNSCVEKYEETIDDDKLSTSEREALTRLAENILQGAENPSEVRRRVDESISRGDDGQYTVHNKAFLKYLAVEVMKTIMNAAIEDAMASLLSDYAEKVDDGEETLEVTQSESEAKSLCLARHK